MMLRNEVALFTARMLTLESQSFAPSESSDRRYYSSGSVSFVALGQVHGM